MLNIFKKLLQHNRSDFRSGHAHFHSQFGGLWTDRTDAVDVLAHKTASLAPGSELVRSLGFFIEHGYVVLKNAVDGASIDAYLADLANQSHLASPLLASVPVHGPQDKAVIPLQEADMSAPLTKVLDTYSVLPSAKPLIFAPAIVDFLTAVFEQDVLAFQSLHFERGSTQAIHQDTAYVVLDEPMHLCASWIALEDVTAGSGELIYYPGSHRLKDWLYSGQFKHYNHERDPHDEHMLHLQSLHDRSAELGLELTSFLPKKGDVLIWSADLAHGGSQISDSTLTRRSLVTHYTGKSVDPHYFKFIPASNRVKRPVQTGCWSTSMYY